MSSNVMSLNSIREKYSTSGDLIFKTALSVVFQDGINNVSNEKWLENMKTYINEKHDAYEKEEAEAKKEGRIVIHPLSRDFELSIYDCAKDIAEAVGQTNTYEFFDYLSRNFTFNQNTLPYERLTNLLSYSIANMAAQIEDDFRYEGDTEDINMQLYDKLLDIGFDDFDLQDLGYQKLVDIASLFCYSLPDYTYDTSYQDAKDRLLDEKIVNTQNELDAVSLDYEGRIVISGEPDEVIKVTKSYLSPIKIIGQSNVELYGNVTTGVWDEAQVNVYDDCIVYAFEEASIQSHDNATVKTYDCAAHNHIDTQKTQDKSKRIEEER